MKKAEPLDDLGWPSQRRSRAERKRNPRRWGHTKASVTIDVIVEAWRRGWGLPQIAFAAGVSWQRIQQRIKIYEDANGPIVRRSASVRSYSMGSASSFVCANCGMTALSARRLMERSAHYFCSRQCLVDYTRTITDEMVEQAITLRFSGNSWTFISKKLQRTIQAIQNRIWKHLISNNMLETDIVDAIWSINDNQSHRSGFAWLVKNTGWAPSKTGAVRAHMYEAGKRRTPHGLNLTEGFHPHKDRAP